METKQKTACQATPDLWFSEEIKDQAAAKAACAWCPLRAPCEELGWEQVHGVWGGLSEEDRRRASPERYAEAKAAAVKESAEFDVVVRDVVARLVKRQAQALEE